VVGAALDDALSRPMSLVELDQYATPAAIPTPGWTPGSVDHVTGGLGAPSPLDSTPVTDTSTYRATASGLRPRPSQVRANSVASAPESVPSDEQSMPPDNIGDLSLSSTTRVIADLAVMAEPAWSASPAASW